jgi:predicted Zn-dependent protease
VQKISRQGPFALITNLVAGITGLFVPVVGNIVGGVGEFAQSLVFSPYSRSQETEADKVGQEMAAKAGWDPAALSAFLSTLEREVDLMSKGPRKPSFFDSHPATPDRVAKTKEHAKDLKREVRPPISASNEAFLQRLDGLVVGQRAANGIVAAPVFLHPDFNFYVMFPEKWQVENSPQKILAAAPEGEAAFVLGAAAEGNDPLDGARAVEKATKSTNIVSQTQPVTINGLPGAHTQIEADGKVKLDITWIAHGGFVYQLVGLAPVRKFDSFQPKFRSVAHSFRPLSASERDSIKEKRIRLVKAQAGESLEALATRAHSAWKTEEVAVTNGLQTTTQLREGQVIKVAVEEPYKPAQPRR